MDFVGKTADGVAFEGGTGEGMAVEIGSGRLIPGFEDQLVGVKVGDEKQINVTFPEDYGSKDLAGKPATFDLKITAVKTAGETKIDDDFAKQLGLQDLEQLKGLLKGQIEQQLNGLTRTYMKRKLLDQLAAGHDFPVPPSMVEAEFDQIWHQLMHETEHEADPEAAKAELEAERDEYRKIAERRVRLGLLLSEIGTANGVEVSQQEMSRLVAQAAQQYGPEDRQRFIQYVQQEPMAAAQLRAPLFEDKVVDFLFDKAEITDREVTREELEAAIESDEGFDTGTHTHDHDNHKPKAKKAAAKKPAKEAAPAEEAAAEAPALYPHSFELLGEVALGLVTPMRKGGLEVGCRLVRGKAEEVMPVDDEAVEDFGHLIVEHQRRPHAGNLVRGDAHAHAAGANKDAEFILAVGDRVADAQAGELGAELRLARGEPCLRPGAADIRHAHHAGSSRGSVFQEIAGRRLLRHRWKAGAVAHAGKARPRGSLAAHGGEPVRAADVHGCYRGHVSRSRRFDRGTPERHAGSERGDRRTAAAPGRACSGAHRAANSYGSARTRFGGARSSDGDHPLIAPALCPRD